MKCRCLVFSFDAVASRISAFSLVEVLEDWFSFYDLSDLNDFIFKPKKNDKNLPKRLCTKQKKKKGKERQEREDR